MAALTFQWVTYKTGRGGGLLRDIRYDRDSAFDLEQEQIVINPSSKNNLLLL